MADPLNEQPFFPYPRDPVMRLGFVIGDVIALAVLLLIMVPVAMNFLR